MMPKTQNRKDNHRLRRVCIVREICVLRLIPNGRRGVVTEQDRGHMTDCLVHDSGLRTSMENRDNRGLGASTFRTVIRTGCLEL
jgi:hypothetical protein